MLPLPTRGQFALVAQHPETTNLKGETKRYTAHAWLTAQDVSEHTPTFQAALDWASACNAAGSDIFYTTGGFEGELEEFTGRKSANVVAQRSLFLDIDCAKWGIDAGTTGFDAIFGWLEAHDNVLIPSLVINSGGGLHVYFHCESDIPLDRWHAAADKLRNGAQQVFHDAVDVQCTIDRARILRVPGFINQKYPALVEQMWPYGDHEQPLYTIEQLEEMVAPWPRTAAALGQSAGADILGALGLTRPAAGPAVTGSAFGNVAKSEPASWERMEQAALRGDGCMVLLNAMEDSSNITYDLWCGLLTIVACTDNVEAGIHAVSRDHPDWGDTQTVDTALAKAQSFGGPRTCRAMRTEACRGCKHNGRITSPVEIGRTHVRLAEATVDVVVQSAPEAAPEEFTLPEPPDKYKYTGKRGAGVYFRTTESTDGGGREDVIVRLWDSPVWIVQRASGGNEASGKLGFFNARNEVVTVDYAGWAGDLPDRMKVLKRLIDRGLNGHHLDSKFGMDMHTAFISAVTMLQTNTSETIKQFGPLAAGDDTGFSIGEVRYLADGTTLKVKIDPALPGARTVEAGLLAKLPADAEVQRVVTEWNAHLRAVHGVQPGLHNPVRALDRLMVASGFGAVLPMFTENESHRGGFVSLMSNAAGSGKTSMVKTAMSIYAHTPSALIVSGTTENGWRGQTWAACALPVVLDDFWQNDRRGDVADRVKKMLLGSTSQSSRATMLGKNDGFTSTWTYMTGNKDVASEIATLDAAAGGALRRMFNIHVPTRTVTVDEGLRFEAFERWQAQHGGVIGHVWVRHVAQHVEQMRERRGHWARRLTEESVPLQNQQYEFVRAILANTLAAADVAGQHGLHPYSMTDLLSTAVSYAQQSWDAMNDAIVPDDKLLSDILSRAASCTIVANRNGSKNFSNDRLPSSAKVTVRRYPDTGEVAISSAGLRELCSQAKVSQARVIADIGNYPFRKVMLDLGEGTAMIGIVSECYLIQLPLTTTPTSQEQT